MGVGVGGIGVAVGGMGVGVGCIGVILGGTSIVVGGPDVAVTIDENAAGAPQALRNSKGNTRPIASLKGLQWFILFSPSAVAQRPNGLN